MNDLDLLIREADNPTTVLDLGCGNFGVLVELLNQQQLVRLVGVDNDTGNTILKACNCESLIALANDLNKYINSCVFGMDSELMLETKKIVFVPATITEYLGSSLEKFDIVILRNVLHYFTNKKQRVLILTEIKNRLTEEGLFLLRVAGNGHAKYRERTDRVTYSKHQLLEEVNLAGLIAGEVFSENNETNLYCVLK